MPFTKDDPNINTKGRPKKGQEKNADIRREWKRILEEETPKSKERLNETKGLSYWKAIDILASRCLPALQSVEMQQDSGVNELLSMSSKERQAMIKDLQNKLNGK